MFKILTQFRIIFRKFGKNLSKKFYTQEEFNTIKNNAKDSFKKESDRQLKLFSDFIKNLEAESIDPSEKVNKASLKKEKIEYDLKDFIY